jgi:hypothetical protein
MTPNAPLAVSRHLGSADISLADLHNLSFRRPSSPISATTPANCAEIGRSGEGGGTSAPETGAPARGLCALGWWNGGNHGPGSRH